MKNILFWGVIAFILISCSKNTELMMDKDHVIGIENTNAQIDNIKVIDWKIGDYRAHIVSKGFILMTNLPHLSDDQIKKLTTHSQVDSWVLRFTKKTDNSTRILGTVYVPFVHHSPNGSSRLNKQDAIYVNIYYAAAALSGRLENLKCPAMNHRKVIDDWEIVKSEGPSKMVFSFSNILPETPVPSEILPEVFNGDMSLIGEYGVEIALYQSTSKVLYSDFFSVGNKVKITSEQEKEVKVCDNFIVPTPDYEHKEKLKEFRFK
ncbi:MAG: hypothetical protein ACOYL6_13570 [Bacteriovoracaceae bacterium]